MSVTAEQRERWSKMRAPTLRGEVKKAFGKDWFNGHLMRAKKDEMIAVLCGEIQPPVLEATLKRRDAASEKKGRKPGRPLGSKTRALAGQRETTMKPRMGRKAASPIPPPSAWAKRAGAGAGGLADTFKLAAELSGIPAIQNAPAEQLRRAVEAFVSIRG